MYPRKLMNVAYYVHVPCCYSETWRVLIKFYFSGNNCYEKNQIAHALAINVLMGRKLSSR